MKDSIFFKDDEKVYETMDKCIDDSIEEKNNFIDEFLDKFNINELEIDTGKKYKE